MRCVYAASQVQPRRPSLRRRDRLRLRERHGLCPRAPVLRCTLDLRRMFVVDEDHRRARARIEATSDFALELVGNAEIATACGKDAETCAGRRDRERESQDRATEESPRPAVPTTL